MLIVPVRSRPDPMDYNAVSGRADPRVGLNGTAAYLSEERIVIAREADVSLSGAFVQTHNPDPIGTLAHLRLERGGEHAVVEVEIVRVSYASNPDGTGAGMGMRFTCMTSHHRRFLAKYVANAQRNEEQYGSPFGVDVDVSDI
jgi:hypothetical protein